MATQTKPQTIRFLCGQYPSLRMTRRTQGEIFMPNGNVANDPSKPELTYPFVHGVLDLREGQDVLLDGLDPETGEVIEQDAIAWLRGTPEFGSVIYEVEPTAPPSSEVLTRVAAAAAAGDIDELVRLGDEEHESWDRQDVLDVILDAIERIKGSTEAKE